MVERKHKKYDPKNDPIWPRREWTSDDIQELLNLWKIIPSINLLSLILKRAPSAIQTQCSRSGLNKSAVLNISHMRRRWNKKDDNALIELVERYFEDGLGLPIFDIARAMHRSIDSTVNRIIYLYDDPYIIRDITIPKTLKQVEAEFKGFVGEDSKKSKAKREKMTDNAIERKCLSCGRMFFSPDRKRIWRCQVCKGMEDEQGSMEYVF